MEKGERWAKICLIALVTLAKFWQSMVTTSKKAKNPIFRLLVVLAWKATKSNSSRVDGVFMRRVCSLDPQSFRANRDKKFVGYCVCEQADSR